jgi:endoglucanase
MEKRERIFIFVLAGSFLMLAMAIMTSGHQIDAHGRNPVMLNESIVIGNLTSISSGDVRNESGDRLAMLQKGVNFYQWFTRLQRRTPEQYRSTVSEEDLQLIASLGFRHVRLQIDLPDIYNFASPGSPNPAMLALIDDTIRRLGAHGLATIITLQVDEEQQTPGFLENGFKELWSALARHFNDTDPEMVFLEVMNEPVFENNPSQWAHLQDELIRTIRAGAPLHTILATGPDWSSIDGLTSLKPTTVDSNVVYVFHFYESMTFTHQGSDWSQDTFMLLQDVPYPVTEEGYRQALDATCDTSAREWIQAYCDEGWDSDLIDARIRQAAEWSRINEVPVIADEFGCIDKAPAADRRQWFSDVRSSLERYGIGWTLWTYDDYMGLDRKTTGRNRTITLNKDVATALGLNMSALKNG